MCVGATYHGCHVCSSVFSYGRALCRPRQPAGAVQQSAQCHRSSGSTVAERPHIPLRSYQLTDTWDKFAFYRHKYNQSMFISTSNRSNLNHLLHFNVIETTCTLIISTTSRYISRPKLIRFKMLPRNRHITVKKTEM